MKEMKKKKNNKSKNYNKLLISIFLLLLLTLTIGYSYLSKTLQINTIANINSTTWDVHYENIEIKEGSIKGTPTIGSDKTSILLNITIGKPGEYFEYTVDVVNKGVIDARVEEVSKTILTNNQESYLSYHVTYEDGEEIEKYDQLKAGEKEKIKVLVQFNNAIKEENFPSTNEQIELKNQIKYIQEEGKGKERNKKRLIKVLSSISQNDGGINFGETSSKTNGEGVYTLSSTRNNKNPIYYYRGSVENNNVIFGGFCWKMIRSTETGGVKIIYNGTPNNGTCDNIGEATEIGKSPFNDQENDPKYVGYMYDNNTKDSTIKGVIDTWFASNLLSYQDYLEDTPFYNERDYVEGVGFPMAFAPRQRVWGIRTDNYAETVPNTTIKLGAANAEDIFTVSSKNGNRALTYPVGLITSDEVVMAGGRGYISESDPGNNTNYYLYTGSLYWSLSPHRFNIASRAAMGGVRGDGRVHDPFVASRGGVRPVISLKQETKYIGGTGTKENPFIITE